MEAPPAPVLYEDDALVAVAKPAGIAAIPERDLAVPSLQKALEALRSERLWVVHRLDKEVSGLLVFARNAASHRHLSLAFERRQVQKTYLALVHGQLGAERGERGTRGTIDQPIHQFGSGRMGIDPRGKPSVTHYDVIGHAAAHTALHAHPVTGRRHQLRVHFYSLGHPIAGDLRYGERALQAEIPRLMLHARALVLPHPDGRSLALEAAPDAEFLAVAAELGIAASALVPEPGRARSRPPDEAKG